MATITTGLSNSIVPRAVSDAPSTSFYVRWGKRLFDVAASLAGLAISSPILIFCALLVRLTSRGPVLFRQTRVGYLGHAFTLIKFRTMKQGAEALGSAVVVNGDPRLTPVGVFLRHTKLDELPQLINVLRGEMSFVGPRPRVPSEVDLDDPKERILLAARPGVTSFASIHHRMEADYCARQADPQAVYRTKVLPQKLSLDSEYVQSPTFLLDLKLIALTFLLIWSPGRSLATGLRILGREVWPYDRGAHIILDLVTYVGAAWLAYTLRYDAGFPDFYRTQLWLFLAFVPPLRVLANRWLRVYDMMWRYVNLVDVFLLAVALAPVTLVLLALRLCLPSPSWEAALLHVPLSVATLEYLIALSAGVGLRSLRRMLYVLQHHYQPLPEAVHRVLILGAGLLGLTTAVDMHQYPQMHLVGFLDDDPAKYRRLLAGCRVLGNSENLEALCARHKVTDLVICVKSIDLDRLLELSERCSGLGVKLHLLPGLDRVLRAEGILPLPADARLSFAGHGGFARARE
ncbi:MAG: sugar transferase [Terriglobia bacterium]|jgi:lipopolysaccharide/colanic/teichoic acid biosynthesis glycosyltransferase